MNKSETSANLFAALAKAQAELKNPKFDSVNPHFKSAFASLAAVRDAVIPVFARHGLSFCQFPITDGIRVGCVNHLAHESGEWMEESFLLPCDKQTAHGYASTLTYVKRLSMQSVAGVVGDKDDDGNGGIDEDKPAKVVNVDEFLRQIEKAESKDALSAIWAKASAACKEAGDIESHQAIKQAITTRGKAVAVAE